MTLYCLHDEKQGKYIVVMEHYTPTLCLGAVDPKTDGNYYKHIVVAGNVDPQGTLISFGLRAWWKWVRSEEAEVIMSEEFSFDPNDVVIRELVLGKIV